MSQSTEKDNITTKIQEYSSFNLKELISPIKALINFNGITNKQSIPSELKGEAAERLAAVIGLVFFHDLNQLTSSPQQGAPKSFALDGSLLLPDFRLDDSQLVEVKFRGSPHTVYSDSDNDIDNRRQTIPIDKYKMEQYAERVRQNEVTIHILVWDFENKNVLIGEVNELFGSELTTTSFNSGGTADEMYCYEYTDFDPASPFRDSFSEHA